jgi:hypothetical protein
MRSSSECVWTVTRVYRHRIVAVQLDGTWHVVLHGYTGAIAHEHHEHVARPTPWGKPSGLSRPGSGFRPPSRGEQAA